METIPKKATREDAEGFVQQAFTDRISWTAAATILQRVKDDPRYGELDPELRGSIERFLEGHVRTF